MSTIGAVVVASCSRLPSHTTGRDLAMEHDAQRYMEQMVCPVVILFAQRTGQNFEFKVDNTCPHRARVAVNCLRQQCVTTLP